MLKKTRQGERRVESYRARKPNEADRQMRGREHAVKM